MIKTEGEYKKYSTTENEMINYLNEAYIKAIEYFSYFVSRYDLEPSLFEHLFNLDLVIDYNDEDACAYYLPRKDNLEIHVFAIYIDDFGCWPFSGGLCRRRPCCRHQEKGR